MALTNTEKAEVRRYMGFPDINRQYDPELEAAMVAVSAEGEVQVRGYLAHLAEIEAALRVQYDCLKVMMADTVRMDPHEAIRTLRREGRRIAKDLAVALDCTPRSEAFSEQRGSRIY